MNYWEQLLEKAKANHLNYDFDKLKLALAFAEEVTKDNTENQVMIISFTLLKLQKF